MSEDWSSKLDPETTDWLEKAKLPNTGVVASFHNGNILISTLLDPLNRPTHAPSEPGVVVWRQETSAASAKQLSSYASPRHLCQRQASLETHYNSSKKGLPDLI